MGQRARRRRSRRRPALPRPAPPRPAASTPPPPGTPYAGVSRWLGCSGIISVLFETPSGFAVLHYDGVKLFRLNALEYIWTEFMDMPGADKAVLFKEFQIFKDKARAINSDGVCSELAEMINRSLLPGQKLAVGKQEYKDIIEASLEIHCLFDEAVLEVIWGLKNLIKMLVPDEKLELTNEDRLQISRGMKSVLDRHGIELNANLVNSDIIDIASTVYEYDLLVVSRDALLEHYGKKIAVVSGIDSKNWGRVKLASALKLICYPEEENLSYDPEEENVTGDPEVMLSKTEAKKLLADADRYEDKLNKRTCLDMYQKIVRGYGIRLQALAQLGSMVKEAKKGLKLHQGPMAKEAEQELKLHPEAVHGQEGKRKFEAAPGVLDAADGLKQKTKV